MKKSASQNFIQGTFILIAAGAIVKIIGAIYKLPLTNLIGKEGMGIFSVAYNIYTALYVLSTAGLPVAVSKMVAEANALGKVNETKKIFSVSMSAFSAIGGICTIVLMVFARQFTNAAGNSMAYYPVLAIAPSLFFTAITSTVRGYYQGLSNMVPTAISQVIEAMCKLVIGLVLSYVLLLNGYPIEIAVAGAIAGVTIGTALSALYLITKRARDRIIVPFKSGSLDTSSSEQILERILKIAVPITIGSSVLSLTNLIDMFVVMNRLQSAGFSEAEANSLYGAYNMALTIFNLPQTLIVAISISIIPAVSAAYAKYQYDRASAATESSLRLAAILALPCAVGFLVLAKPIMELLYYKKLEDARIGAPLLALLGFAVLFVGMVSLTNSILQAAGKVNIPVITMLIGGGVKLIVNYVLVGNPLVNIHGAPVGTVCCYAAITILNIICIIRFTSIPIKISKIFIKPLAASAIMGGAAYLCQSILTRFMGNSRLPVIISIIIAVPVYFFMLLLINGVTREDLKYVPKGEKIIKLFKIK